MNKQFLEDCLAKEMSLEAIGARVGRHPSTVSRWLKKYRLSASGATKHSPRGPLCPSRLRALVDEEATLAEMAERLDRSVSTIRYWLSRHGIETSPRRRSCPGPGREGKTATFRCRRHGATEFVRESAGYYRCKKCRASAVTARRRTVKRKLVEEAGGACALCGYRRCVGALQFHHVDPRRKKFNLSQGGCSRSLTRSRSEIRKCVLLCANCHAEVEGGFATLPMAQGASLA
jgi:transposase